LIAERGGDRGLPVGDGVDDASVGDGRDLRVTRRPIDAFDGLRRIRLPLPMLDEEPLDALHRGKADLRRQDNEIVGCNCGLRRKNDPEYR
jgi:hypothetical protein